MKFGAGAQSNCTLSNSCNNMSVDQLFLAQLHTMPNFYSGTEVTALHAVLNETKTAPNLRDASVLLEETYTGIAHLLNGVTFSYAYGTHKHAHLGNLVGTVNVCIRANN